MWVDLPDGRRDVTYPDVAYVARHGRDGDYSWNCNNYVHGGTARLICPSSFSGLNGRRLTTLSSPWSTM